MERGVTYRSLVEYFLLMHNSGNSNTLVYYDQEGTRFEKPIERGHIEHALQKFDGKPKAVARSSGGLVRAAPYQLVLCDEEMGNGKVTPRPKVKVKFKEFKRDANGRLIADQVQTVSKLVEPEQLIELFSYRLQGPQRFVLDLGRGIVPVHVFEYVKDPMGAVQALFVEVDDIERVLLHRGDLATFVSVQPYKIPRDLLRYACACNSYGFDEYDLALENYRVQKEDEKEAVPQSLRCGPCIEVPANLSYDQFSREMEERMKDLAMLLKISIDEAPTDESSLVPFGAFEKQK